MLMDNEELSFAEMLSIILALWGIDLSYKNLKLNLGQEDKDDIIQKLDEQTTVLLSDIHNQLEMQNAMLNEQTELLKNILRKE